MKIILSKNLSFPADLVTQVVAILAKRRAGKSYTMRRMTEQLLHADQQIILIDPKGDQWGIRSSADGKSPGYPVLILGEEHGDLPIDVNAGEVIAKLAVEERVSMLLDLSVFRKHEVATFMTAFLENLYRLKAQEKYRTPVMLVVDEADAIAPQKPQRGEERMLGAIEDIVRRGGQRGIGCTLVTQRSAVLNKNVLTQAQMLVVLRTIAPQDIAAMKAWIDVHGTVEEGRTLIASLPSLPVGDAWFWSPGWPTDEGIFTRTHVSKIETFDSSATPKAGERRIAPKSVADVDLDALKGQMSSIIEKAKQTDPKKLQAEVYRLTKRIAELEARPHVVNPTKVEKITVPAVGKRTLDGLKKIHEEAHKTLAKAREYAQAANGAVDTIEASLAKFSVAIGNIEGKESIPAPRVIQNTPARHYPSASSPQAVSPIEPVDQSTLTNPESRILNAIAWLNSIGVLEPAKSAVAFLAGYTYGSGGFNNPCGALRTKGLIEYRPANKIILTSEGQKVAKPPEEALTQDTLHEKVMSVLPTPEQRILRPLLQKFPDAMSNEELAEASGYMLGSGGFNNPKGRLRTLGLIEYPQGGYAVASNILFP